MIAFDPHRQSAQVPHAGPTPPPTAATLWFIVNPSDQETEDVLVVPLANGAPAALAYTDSVKAIASAERRGRVGKDGEVALMAMTQSMAPDWLPSLQAKGCHHVIVDEGPIPVAIDVLIVVAEIENTLKMIDAQAKRLGIDRDAFRVVWACCSKAARLWVRANNHGRDDDEYRSLMNRSDSAQCNAQAAAALIGCTLDFGPGLSPTIKTASGRSETLCVD